MGVLIRAHPVMISGGGNSGMAIDRNNGHADSETALPGGFILTKVGGRREIGSVSRPLLV